MTMDTGVPDSRYAFPKMSAKCWYFSGLKSCVTEMRNQLIAQSQDIMLCELFDFYIPS